MMKQTLDNRIVDRLSATQTQMDALCRLGGASMSTTVAITHMETGGKRLRARLAVQAAELIGADGDWIVAWASACELLHNATLVHDDLQDGDTERRGKPSAWAQFGMAQALTAGDMMLMLPYAALAEAELDADKKVALIKLMAARAIATAAGQATELELLRDPSPSWDKYFAAANGKTGQFFALPIEGVVRGAGLDDDTCDRIGRAFEHVGVAFQLLDDVHDIFGHKGRRPGNDLVEGKATALVLAHLELAPMDHGRLWRILRATREETRQSEIDWAAARFREVGTVNHVIEMARNEETKAYVLLASSGLLGLAALAQSILTSTFSTLPESH